jgi:hypothetical protein
MQVAKLLPVLGSGYIMLSHHIFGVAVIISSAVKPVAFYARL